MNFAYIAINVRNYNSKADFMQIYPVSEGYLRKILVERKCYIFEYKTLNLLIITVIQDKK